MDRVLTVVGRRIEAVAAEELIRTDDQSPVVGSQEQVEGVCLSRGKLEDQSNSSGWFGRISRSRMRLRSDTELPSSEKRRRVPSPISPRSAWSGCLIIGNSTATGGTPTARRSRGQSGPAPGRGAGTATAAVRRDARGRIGRPHRRRHRDLDHAPPLRLR